MINLRTDTIAFVPGPFVVDYDPLWPVAADRWLARIADAVTPLVGNEEFALQHIGSTAVPGLGAKPIVDLQLLVPRLPDEVVLAEVLAPLGFELAAGSRPDSPGVRFDIPRPSPEVPDPAQHVKLLFHRPAADEEPEMVLHVRLADSPFADFVLAFRDWLRASESNAHRYERLKRMLAAEHAGATDYDDYTRAKSAFLDEVQIEMGWSDVSGRS